MFEPISKMDLPNLLLLNGSFLLAGLVLLILLQANNKKFYGLGFLGNQNTLPRPKNIPGRDRLLELEELAKKRGSGIEFNDLIGAWKFQSVWKKDSDLEDSLSSTFLRIFSASLELKGQTNQNLQKFEVINSIAFGGLKIEFVASGELQGSQPLLSFFFQNISLNLGEKVLLSRSLEIPDKRNRPFFALISIDSRKKWLAARGRAGGLAVWIKDN